MIFFSGNNAGCKSDVEQGGCQVNGGLPIVANIIRQPHLKGV
jgi:hypothetical protein